MIPALSTGNEYNWFMNYRLAWAIRDGPALPKINNKYKHIRSFEETTTKQYVLNNNQVTFLSLRNSQSYFFHFLR